MDEVSSPKVKNWLDPKWSILLYKILINKISVVFPIKIDLLCVQRVATSFRFFFIKFNPLDAARPGGQRSERILKIESASNRMSNRRL